MSINLHTDFTSLGALRNLSSSTNSIATTMKRLSTGIRLNSSADNAADLSLSKNIDSKTSGLTVANNNIQTGVSKLQTYDGYLGGIANDLIRIRDLAVQASNGIYSSSERAMLNNESSSLLGEIEQASSQANEEVGAAQVNVTGLINDITKTSEADAITAGYTVIKTATQFKTAINAGLNGKYILGNDIDMSELGTVNKAVVTGNFTGTFDGNGYKIKNLTITSAAADTGLFGYTDGAKIKNVGLQNANITNTGAIGIFMNGSLVGEACNTSIIENCYSENVTITANNIQAVGGLVGWLSTNSEISSSYTTGNVTGRSQVGGLVGQSYNSSKISNSYSTSSVSGSSNTVGGLVGSNHTNSSIVSCYTTGNVSCAAGVSGGLVGSNYRGSSITSSYATGNVSGTSSVGGLSGYNYTNCTITSSYATGNVSGTLNSGGLVGKNIDNSGITLSYSTGNIAGINNAGGLVGLNSLTSNISSSYATGNTSGTDKIGGFVGDNDTSTITSSCSSGKATGSTLAVGGFLGSLTSGTVDGTNFWDTELSGTTNSAGGMGKTTEEYKKNQSTWDGTVWDTMYDQPQLKSIKSGNLGIQVGENTGENSFYGLKQLALNYSGFLNIDLSTDTGARAALSSIDSAINYLSSKRSDVGTGISGLKSRLETNSTRNQNLTASTSILRDTDMAVETAKLTKNQILQNMTASIVKQSRTLQSNTIMQLITG